MKELCFKVIGQHIPYHKRGTIKRGRQIVAHYFKGDKISDESMEFLESHGHVKVVGVQSEYAPELKRVAVVVLTRAERKRIKGLIDEKERVNRVIRALEYL